MSVLTKIYNFKLLYVNLDFRPDKIYILKITEYFWTFARTPLFSRFPDIFCIFFIFFPFILFFDFRRTLEFLCFLYFLKVPPVLIYICFYIKFAIQKLFLQPDREQLVATQRLLEIRR